VLYGNLAGTLFMTICLMVYLTAYQLGKKMTQIEV
jgi:tight adherence protein B